MEEIFGEMRRYAKERNIPVMLGDSARLLYDTVKSVNPKKILEIGTAIGFSGSVMLTAAAEAELFTVDIDESAQNAARENFEKAGVLSRVTFWTGDAAEIVRYLTGSFDFILLDGPKGHYYEFLPYLYNALTEGGVIFADNVLFKGYTESETVKHKHRTIVTSLRRYLDAVGDITKFDTALHDIGDGVCISVKK